MVFWSIVGVVVLAVLVVAWRSDRRHRGAVRVTDDLHSSRALEQGGVHDAYGSRGNPS